MGFLVYPSRVIIKIRVDTLIVNDSVKKVVTIRQAGNISHR